MEHYRTNWVVPMIMIMNARIQRCCSIRIRVHGREASRSLLDVIFIKLKKALVVTMLPSMEKTELHGATIFNYMFQRILILHSATTHRHIS